MAQQDRLTQFWERYDERLSALERIVQQQGVELGSIRAAVENLSNHINRITQVLESKTLTWGTVATVLSAMVAAVTVIGWLALTPVSQGMQETKQLLHSHLLQPGHTATLEKLNMMYNSMQDALRKQEDRFYHTIDQDVRQHIKSLSDKIDSMQQSIHSIAADNAALWQAIGKSRSDASSTP